MMSEICQKSKDFLTEILTDLRFDLSVSAEVTGEGCLLNMNGADTSLLLNEGGELLDAFETLLFQIYGRELEKTERFICDAEGFRQTRKAELQAMARFAAQNVRKSGKPFTFGVLNSTERRLIHLTLIDETDLQTESIGVGRERRLQVKLK
jgi:spoIIIJ-associated protein